jgi:hypothetical protein
MAGPWKAAGSYGGAGVELVVAVVLTAGVGHWLDGRYWGGHEWGLVGGAVLGFAAGLRNLIRSAEKMQRDIEREDAEVPPGKRWTVDEDWVHKAPEDDARDSGDHESR